jgi:hypothetical protein
MRRRQPRLDADHARLIAAAAHAVLPPLGCRQKGRSPLWIADHGLWVILVDFGHFPILTVGASFLWFEQATWSFDHGTRIADFAAAEPFAPVAQAVARRAAEEVAAVRAKFSSIAAIAGVLESGAGDAPWPLYHAAVASGLAGDGATAARLFRRLDERPATRDWEVALLAQARALASALDDPAAFRATVGALVARTRALNGLPPDRAAEGRALG